MKKFAHRAALSGRKLHLMGILSALIFVSIAIFLLLHQSHQEKKLKSVNNSTSINQSEVLAFVGIQTGFSNHDRRKSLRSTWLPSTPSSVKRMQECSGLIFKFVLGRSSNNDLEALISLEVAAYDDFLRLDMDESYASLNKKTLVFFQTALFMFKAKFYIKADDDIYLRPDRLASVLVSPRVSPLTYLGCMKMGPVIRDKRLKWYEPQSHILGSSYFLHAYGPLYGLSSKVVSLLSGSPDGSLRMFVNEDVTVGSWMLAWNVTHEHNIQFCQRTCSSAFVAVWDIPACSGLCDAPRQLLDLHRLQECSGKNLESHCVFSAV